MHTHNLFLGQSISFYLLYCVSVSQAAPVPNMPVQGLLAARGRAAKCTCVLMPGTFCF